jgi:hypothetical protein
MRFDPADVHMSRKHGQELRTDVTGPSFKSIVSKMSYWAGRLAEKTVEAEDTFAQNTAALGHDELQDLTAFEQANIQQATLESAAAPSGNQQPEVAGLSGGMAPPPPPAR